MTTQAPSTRRTPPRLPLLRPAMPRRRLAGLRIVAALILREMATTYGRSPGGYLWSVLEPVAGIALLTLAFSAFIRSPGLGVNFPLFYATGMMPFMAYQTVSGRIAQALTFSRPLLAYPVVTCLDAVFARFLLAALTEFMVAFIVFAGILAVFDTRVIPDYPLILEAMALALFLGLGVGTMNCWLMTRFQIWQRVWAVLTRPLFLVSGIFFLFETVPEPFRGLLWFNPLVHVIGVMRRGFYTGYEALWVSRLYVLGLSAILLAIGIMLLRRDWRRLLQL